MIRGADRPTPPSEATAAAAAAAPLRMNAVERQQIRELIENHSILRAGKTLGFFDEAELVAAWRELGPGDCVSVITQRLEHTHPALLKELGLSDLEKT